MKPIKPCLTATPPGASLPQRHAAALGLLYKAVELMRCANTDLIATGRAPIPADSFAALVLAIEQPEGLCK